MTAAPPIRIDAAATAAALPFDALIAALRDAFAGPAEAPPRHHHEVGVPGGPRGTLLLMPAAQGAYLGTKLVTNYPGNGAFGLPSTYSTYLLCERATGRPLALVDGDVVTSRRTAAVAALAADFLARRDARRLLVLGAGRVARLLPTAFAAVRPIDRVAIWSPRPDRAATLCEALAADGIAANPVADLAAAAAEADVVSCATLARAPVIEGRWLQAGAHLDLIGSFSPDMREADDAAMAQARIWVDSDGAVTEAGDLVQPLEAGVIAPDAIVGTLAQLCAGTVAARRDDRERTVFKAVGTALADIAAAALAYRTVEILP